MDSIMSMEAFVSLLNLKAREFLMERNADVGKDIISKLPDSILIHILSFLPIKDVLRTSVLSTRWKYLWTSISNIYFDETSNNFPSGMRASIRDSVNKVFLLHDPSSIQKFRLRSRRSVSRSRLNSWVSTAISHKVEELDLHLPVSPSFKLPDTLFTSDTLSILKLNMEIVFKVPRFTRFSNLRTLSLRKVKFHGNQYAEHLFSACLVLQELVLYKCVLVDTTRITISIPTLRKLEIRRPLPLDYQLYGCCVTVCAENLISLSCKRCAVVELVLSNLSSMKDAYIDEECSGYQDNEFTRRVIEVLGGMHNVQSLRLSYDTLQCLAREKNLQASLPMFHNLIHLKVIKKMYDYTNEEVLMSFLEKSPNVKTLELPEVWVKNIFPQCLKSCIKTVSIAHFEGWYREVLFLKHLLRNSNVLERLTVFCGKDLARDLRKLNEINHELQAIHSCEIEFRKGFKRD
ncbi:hypothetical protein Pint_04897 [Pistacia integerrima]|uniref:Uncharacterized protein n=1 Tax=Pistacia integerrima TaxID=434235 RepID=A0ACC0Z5L2_9ROSI|nr:hypothetical protein Pint_04897 [Pistacia integerrima]